MCFWCAGSNYNPVKVLIIYHMGNGILGILGAGVKIVRDIFHIREGCRIIPNCWHINHTTDIDPTLAYKYTDTWPFTGNIPFFWDVFFLN